ncbi:MAG: hypothetical protein EAZ77_08660 [Nostocales cyanobacterium]|nr:MAG: hypothetical protein EAZ77_08660 [Nostocales cyanobacterium]
MPIPPIPGSGTMLSGVNWSIVRISKISLNPKFFSDLSKIAAEFRRNPDLYRDLGNRIKEVKEIKDVNDAIVDKVPGGGSNIEKARKIGSTASALIGIGGVAVILAMKIKLDELTQAAQEKTNDILSNDLSKALGLIQTNKSRIDTANEKIEALRLQDQRNRDRIYAQEQKLPEVRKLANDALYEVRAGRNILESKINANQQQAREARQLGNDALYEVRAGRGILQKQIASVEASAKTIVNNAKAEFNKLINTNFKDLSKQVSEYNKQVADSNKKTDKTNNDAIAIQKTIDLLKGQVSEIKNTPKETPVDVNKIREQIYSEVLARSLEEIRRLSPGNNIEATPQKDLGAVNKYDLEKLKKEQDKRWNDNLWEIAKTNNAFKKMLEDLELFKERTKLDFEASQGLPGAMKKLEERFQRDTQNQQAAWKAANDANGVTFSEALRNMEVSQSESLKKIKEDQDNARQKEIDKIDKRLNDNEKKIGASINQSVSNEVTKGLSPINGELIKIKQDLNQKTRDIEKIDTKIKERIAVDQRVEKKIDSIIPTIAGIPIIVGRIPGQTTNLITPKIPTTPQIGNVVKESVCNPKCQLPSINGFNNAANNAANDIKKDIGQKIRDGNDAIQTGALAEVLRRLGDFIPGGISGKLVNGFKWLQLDRALNILTFGATIHNAAMLSNDIVQTLVGALTNVITLIVPKDDAGKGFDIGEAINSTVANVVKGIVGAENYTNLSNAWAKANRIYQATTNVLNSFMGLTQTVLQAAEMIAAYTGKIGNALRKGGVVLENAYGWMNPQPKFNRVTETLEKLQQAASTVQMVTQVPLDVVNATTELTTASTDFVKAIKEDDKDKNKATPVPEPDDLKAKETEAKEASNVTNPSFEDLFNNAD